MDGEIFKEDREESNLSVRSKYNVLNWLKKLPLQKRNVFDLLKIKHEEEIIIKHDGNDAQFIGWEKTPTGEVFALYNVLLENHPLYHSTVSEKTLREQNLNIPLTPPLPKNFKKFEMSK